MIRPPFLEPGQRVGILAMASRLEYEALEPAFHTLRDQWQLEVVEGESLRSSYFQFAGDDALRTRDLQRMLDDPSIRAIFSARGGYGSYRILDRLDFTQFLKNPKWIIGFSDITVVHCHLHRMGVQSLHAIMPKLFGSEGVADSIETLRQCLFGESPTPYTSPSHRLSRPGTATGPLVGGNLTMLMHILGTPSDVDLSGKLLFIEDIDETLFSTDRMMIQLRRSGRLADLAGLLVGQFTDMRINESSPFGKTANEIIAEQVAGYNYPVCFDFPVGHVARNLALPIGKTAELVVKEEGGRLRF
ncbi:S66 peptidase family protein [Larkinella humicola]|uniref:LD-carboxypeptidase n=1 Tax=Larkinella humicola TaxID=2607654 RepID=A0A5N1JGW7_9BACT|nr:LD-carboxypeptidase [Larkinella humicola]KAA9354954.1 LD-carboxypeptidase [Larkinella humicola]